MKHPADAQTQELLSIPNTPKKRGRPATGHAKSAAERMAEYRNRQKAAEPNQRRMLHAIEELFRRLEHTPNAEQYHQLHGAIMALEWANMLDETTAERAKEWAYCAWRKNGFKR